MPAGHRKKATIKLSFEITETDVNHNEPSQAEMNSCSLADCDRRLTV